ncbi:hypothetical protein BSIN_3764 [Burkholderia singularis]|uniref:Uncharacterized protein n=1 Tax=Burkholderia singularis TaxID=1503053 RepID=A0A238H5F6_9BURK|nr:hypothetical protein BSIN_3764 [Burkholderia singularis]
MACRRRPCVERDTLMRVALDSLGYRQPRARQVETLFVGASIAQAAFIA